MCLEHQTAIKLQVSNLNKYRIMRIAIRPSFLQHLIVCVCWVYSFWSQSFPFTQWVYPEYPYLTSIYLPYFQLNLKHMTILLHLLPTVIFLCFSSSRANGIFICHIFCVLPLKSFTSLLSVNIRRLTMRASLSSSFYLSPNQNACELSCNNILVVKDVRLDAALELY